jgi:hypothetical protein
MKQKLFSISAGCALLLLATAAQAQYFKGMDLGGPTEPGSFTDNGGGSWTITGGGGDIWGNSDQCYYYYAWASGSEWVATVKCTDLQGPDNWTKAEMMVRLSDPNLGPQANDGFIATMTTRAAGQNQIGPQYRASRGTGAGNTGTTATPTYPNLWLRLARTNSSFTMSWSSDNVTFNVLRTIDTSATTDGFGTPWPDSVTVGLAVTSHNNDAGQIGTAQFENLQVSFPAVTPPTAIGAQTQVTGTSAYPGSAATFTFVTTNNAIPNVVGGGYVLYQWYKNGTAISNATATSYSHLVNPSDPAENGAQYHCTATVQPPYNGTVSGMNSATGTLSVLPGAVYYTNGLKQEFFSGGTRIPIERGNVGQATRITRLPALDSNGGMGDNYSTRNSGWFIPPASDSYVFFIASDDDCDLFISTDGNPANKRLVAQETSWSGTRSWLNAGAGSTTQKRSDQWSPDGGTTVPYSAGIPLTVGVPYYVEVVMHQGSGGDNMGVTYQTTNQVADPNFLINFTNSAPSLMTSEKLVLITGPTTTLTWSQQPTNTSVSQGNTTTFYAQANTDSEFRPLYQWYRNNTPIAGATGTSWSTGATTPADNGALITVVASTVYGGFSITSSPAATLGVISAVRENGWTKVEYWPSANRAGIENGTAGNPNYVYAAPAFEANVNNVNRSGNARRLSGYFIPPTTDDYVFFVNADDDSDLFLSTDNTVANKRLIAQETAWSNPRQWTAAGSGSAATKRSDSWQGTNATPPYAAGIHLIANQQYYIEQVQANGGGGDNAQVTYKRITDPDPALGSASSIQGSVVSSFAPRCNWVAFTQQPTNPPAVASSDAGSVSFSAAGTTDSQISIGTVTDGTPAGWPYVTFQWQKNGVDIPGAITGTYSLSSPFLPSDNGAVFTCKLRALGYADNLLNPIWSNSAPATLTVVTNTPNLVYAALYTNSNVVPWLGGSLTYVTLAFDSPMDPVLLGQASTYTLGGGLTIVSVNVNTNNYRSVTLEVSGNPTFPFTVQINSNVSGLGGGAKVANTTLPVKTIPLTNADIGTAGSDPTVPGTIVATGTNSYTISCEGSDIWGSFDGFNFTYEMKTNNFDVVVRQKDTKHTSNWAKGGLMVRETLDSGSRNWNIVNDPLASDGIQAPDGSGMGASLVECNRRATSMSASDGWGIIGTQPAPAFPNAWVRLKRTGDDLSAYYSTNGLTWTLLATNNPTRVGESNALPAAVYVGICLTAHNNDPLGTPADQLRFVNTANFTDYDSNYVPPASGPPATLTTSKSGNNLNISWTPAGGHLESSPVVGPGAVWTPVGTANPASVPIGTGNQYFRVVNP